MLLVVLFASTFPSFYLVLLLLMFILSCALALLSAYSVYVLVNDKEVFEFDTSCVLSYVACHDLCS